MEAGAKHPRVADTDVVYCLRDLSNELAEAWRGAFSNYKENVKVSAGDIFRDAPAVDAIVSPANSFGFMTGGIDLAYSKHFGRQLQERLQQLIRTKYRGELLVGQSAIIPTYANKAMMTKKDLSNFNQGQPIKFLISAPTMRVGSTDVSDTTNVYTAFRGIILAVRDHNSVPENEQIRSVLVPGLATSIGRMHKSQCAWQMLQAYETYVMGMHNQRLGPTSLKVMINDHKEMTAWVEESGKKQKLTHYRSHHERLNSGSSHAQMNARPSFERTHSDSGHRKQKLGIEAYFSHSLS